MVNELEWYIVDLLQGKLFHDGEKVEVVKQFSQHPTRPVITLDIQSVTTQQVFNNPSLARKYYEYKADININVWCDTERQRESLVQQITDCFYQEQTYHYRYCEQYSDGRCMTTGGNCTGVTNAHYRCKDPDTLGYSSLRYLHNIIPGTLVVDPPFELDDLSDHPPLLRSIFRCSAQYSIPVGESFEVESVSMGDVELMEEEDFTEDLPLPPEEGGDPDEPNPLPPTDEEGETPQSQG
jgi:hypothetical protein